MDDTGLEGEGLTLAGADDVLEPPRVESVVDGGVGAERERALRRAHDGVACGSGERDDGKRVGVRRDDQRARVAAIAKLERGRLGGYHDVDAPLIGGVARLGGDAGDGRGDAACEALAAQDDVAAGERLDGGWLFYGDVVLAGVARRHHLAR